MGTGTVKHCDAIDLFAGAGGWDLAAAEMGLDVLGIELDKDACDTRAAAGLRTHKGDIAALDPADFAPQSGRLQGLIASPPCQAFSTAGKRLGETDKPLVFDCINSYAETGEWRAGDVEWADERSALVLEPLRWARVLQPTWIALEQVPPVLEVWQWFANVWRHAGYHVWTGVLSAERYSVPQTRKRAILLAHRDRPVAPPAPTHQEYVPGVPASEEMTLEGVILPWVSMAQALGYVYPRRPTHMAKTEDRLERREQGAGNRPRSVDAPAATVDSRADLAEWVYDRRQGSTRPDGSRDMVRPVPVPVPVSEPAPTLAAEGLAKGRDVFRQVPASTAELQADDWPEKRPATTLAGDPRVFQPGGHHTAGQQSQNAVRVSLEEASILQSFPPDFPWSGSKSAQFLQVGNAIPLYLARAVLGQVAEPSSASGRAAA